jgi:hypothetical protein
MTDERRGSRGQAATQVRRRTAKAPSAGLPAPRNGSPDERLAELEGRLARLETTTGLRERGRDLMGRVAPPEAGRHFRNAGREQLLGIRSIVDFWIRRIELAEERAGEPATTRERIEIN